MMKYVFRLLLPVTLLLLLSGCWSYSELNERTIIAGAAVDLTESGEILLTAETVEFSEGDSPSVKAEILTGKGRSIAEAVYDIMNQSGKELYWYQATLLVIDNKYAEKGIRELLDYILNVNEMRLTLKLAVSRLETAAEVFELECHGSNIKSFAIDSIIKEQSGLGKTVSSDAYYIINRMLEPGAEFALSQILSDVSQKSATVDIAGCGVFKDDKLAGWLDDEETVFVQLLSGNVQKAEFDFILEGSRVAVNASDWKIKTRPTIAGGKAETDVEINAEYEILVIDGDLDVNETADTEKISAALGRFVESHLKDMVEHLQALSCDALGWGNLVWQSNPEGYNGLASWYDIFSDMDTRLTMKFNNNNNLAGNRVRLS